PAREGSASGRYGNKRPAGERSATKRLSGTAATLQAVFRAPVAKREGAVEWYSQPSPIAAPRAPTARLQQAAAAHGPSVRERSDALAPVQATVLADRPSRPRWPSSGLRRPVRRSTTWSSCCL